MEGLIRDYIIYLKTDKKLAPGRTSAYLSPISHFYEMNDIDLRWKKLKKFKAKFRSVVEDKPYTREQIKILIDSTYLRDKCIILLMASAGLRRGALPYLRIHDFQRIQKYDLYKISVYKKEQEQYATFCTPECTKYYINQYLDWRRRLGEKLLPNSPLFRVVFDPITQINKPKPVSTHVVNAAINTLLEHTGTRLPIGQQHQRTELMQTHGFRKFFKTTYINAGMNPLYSEYLMGHHFWSNQVIFQTLRHGITWRVNNTGPRICSCNKRSYHK